MTTFARLLSLCLAGLALSCGRATALDYPTQPVRFIVCFAAGGPNDIIARLVGQYLSDYLGQQFIIENRVGAGGNIGTQALSRRAAGRLHHRLRRPQQRHQRFAVRKPAV